MKVTEGPRGAIFSVWKKVGDALKEVHLESRHFPSESEAEAAARKWIDEHARVPDERLARKTMRGDVRFYLYIGLKLPIGDVRNGTRPEGEGTIRPPRNLENGASNARITVCGGSVSHGLESARRVGATWRNGISIKRCRTVVLEAHRSERCGH